MILGTAVNLTRYIFHVSPICFAAGELKQFHVIPSFEACKRLLAPDVEDFRLD